MAEDLSNLGGVALLQNSFPHPTPRLHHPTHKSPSSVLLCGTLQSFMIPPRSQAGFYAVFQHLLLAPERQQCQVPFWTFIALHGLPTEMRITSQGSPPCLSPTSERLQHPIHQIPNWRMPLRDQLYGVRGSEGE